MWSWSWWSVSINHGLCPDIKVLSLASRAVITFQVEVQDGTAEYQVCSPPPPPPPPACLHFTKIINYKGLQALIASPQRRAKY